MAEAPEPVRGQGRKTTAVEGDQGFTLTPGADHGFGRDRSTARRPPGGRIFGQGKADVERVSSNVHCGFESRCLEEVPVSLAHEFAGPHAQAVGKRDGIGAGELDAASGPEPQPAFQADDLGSLGGPITHGQGALDMHQSARIHPGVGRVAIDQGGQDHEGVALPARDDLNARRIAPLGGGQASGLYVEGKPLLEARKHLAHQLPELIVGEKLAPGQLLALASIQPRVTQGAQCISGEYHSAPESARDRGVLLDEETHAAGCVHDPGDGENPFGGDRDRFAIEGHPLGPVEGIEDLCHGLPGQDGLAVVGEDPFHVHVPGIGVEFWPPYPARGQGRQAVFERQHPVAGEHFSDQG